MYLYTIPTHLFSWIAEPDTDPLFIIVCDPFPDHNPHFVTRSDPDRDPKFLTRSRSLYYLYI